MKKVLVACEESQAVTIRLRSLGIEAYSCDIQEESGGHPEWHYKKDIFEDPSQPIEKRIADLLSQMTLEEKTCQLATLYGYGRVLKDELPTDAWSSKIWKDGIANIDEHLNNTTFHYLDTIL